MTLDFYAFCLCLSSPRLTATIPWLQCWGLKPGHCVCWASELTAKTHTQVFQIQIIYRKSSFTCIVKSVTSFVLVICDAADTLQIIHLWIYFPFLYWKSWMCLNWGNCFMCGRLLASHQRWGLFYIWNNASVNTGNACYTLNKLDSTRSLAFGSFLIWWYSYICYHAFVW